MAFTTRLARRGIREADFLRHSSCLETFSFLIVLAAAMTARCGGTPPSSPQTPSGTISVTGTERVGWDQAAPDGQVSQYTYVAYVDGANRQMVAATCQPSADGTQAQCAAPLPHMSAGAHTLQLAAIAGGAESAMSGALNLVVTSAATDAPAPSPAPVPAPRRNTASDGTSFTVETLATALDLPSSIVVLPDGRIAIAQSDGDIRMWKDGVVAARPALHLAQTATGSGAGLIGMTLGPTFAQTHLIYIAYTARADDDGFTNRIIRAVEANGVFFNQAVLFEDPVGEAPQRTPRLRFGPDGKLYVLFPSGADRSSSQASSTYEGKILRLNADGTTPPDNPGGTPVVSSAHRAAAFDWYPATSEMWLADRGWDGRDVLMQGAAPDAVYSFESLVDPAAAVFYTRTELPQFRGDLFIAALDGRHIRRVRLDPNTPGRVLATEPLVANQFGRISDIAVGPDGAIDFCTANSTPDSTDDMLLRIVPRS